MGSDITNAMVKAIAVIFMADKPPREIQLLNGRRRYSFRDGFRLAGVFAVGVSDPLPRKTAP
jgi:hypothetical protein